MVPLTETAILLAERVAPDEIDVAPALAQAAAEGGAQWQAARAGESGSMLGGSGLETYATLFGQVLEVIKVQGGTVTTLWALGSMTLQIVGYLRAQIGNWREGSTAPTISEAARQQADGAVDILAKALIERGVPVGRAAEISRWVLVTLLEDPTRGQAFVEALRR